MSNEGDHFSVVDFLWEEIHTTSHTPSKSCAYAPYIIFMIKKVTKKNFFKEVKHVPYRVRLVCSKSSSSMPPSPPRLAPSTAQKVAPRRASSSRDSSSFIKSALKAIFNDCTHNAVKIKEHKDKTNLRLRKIEKRQKAIHTYLRIEPPCSPISSEEKVSELKSFWESMDLVR